MSDPYDFPKACIVCGNRKFYHFDDYGCDYDYCTECNASYDEDFNLMPEGPEPEMDGQEILHNLLTRR